MIFLYHLAQFDPLIDLLEHDKRFKLFFSTSSENILIGDIESINDNGATVVIKVNCEIDLIPPTTDSFIFFSKDNVANISSVRGYYGLIKFKNNSTASSELFTVGCDISQSSK